MTKNELCMSISNQLVEYSRRNNEPVVCHVMVNGELYVFNSTNQDKQLNKVEHFTSVSYE